MRSITIDELSGFREALLELCIAIDLSEYNTIDLCGTGGDGKNTFNISTLSFVCCCRYRNSGSQTRELRRFVHFGFEQCDGDFGHQTQ